MNTAGIREEIGKKYDLTKQPVHLAGAENGKGNATDAGTAEGVSLELSEEGCRKLTDSKSELAMFKEQMERMQKDNEKASEHGDDMAKIMTIFRRIANGDIVPPRDEKKLMEHSMEMYQAAQNLGSMKQSEERKKHKSVDEEEEKSGAISHEEAVRALVREGTSVGGSAEEERVAVAE